MMRIGTGASELLASNLLFDLSLQQVGAALSLGVMSGAIFFHLVSPLGTDPYGHGGVLFRQAISVWVASIAILLSRRRQAMMLANRYPRFLRLPALLKSP